VLRCAALFLFLASSAFACRCVEPPASTAYAHASTVVMVKVLSTLRGNTPTGVVVQAQVSESWKIPASGTISIATDTDCAYPFLVGEEYLLFLVKDQAGNYSTGRCMGNLVKASSAKSVAWLRTKAATKGK